MDTKSQWTNAHAPASRSDMHRLLFDEGAQFGTQGFFRHQIDRTAQGILQIKLDPKIMPRDSGTIERHHDIHIAAEACFIMGLRENSSNYLL